MILYIFSKISLLSVLLSPPLLHSLLHTLTERLLTHDYVRVVALDFSKAFDAVTLSRWLEDLHISLYLNNVHKWIPITFPAYSTRQKPMVAHLQCNAIHQCKYNPGLCLGSCGYYVFSASDLTTFSPTNSLCKYTDDTYLLVPATNTIRVPQELQRISDWASANNLKLNNAKSQGMIVHHPRKNRQFTYPNVVPGIKRVDRLNILWVTVSQTLTFHNHVNVVVEKTTIKTNRAHGLDGNALWDVTRATVVAQLLYASPAWWGFLKADEKSRLQSVVRRARRYGYLPTSFKTLDELRVIGLRCYPLPIIHDNPHHVLHRLLPQPSAESPQSNSSFQSQKIT